MKDVECLKLGLFQVNCYILYEQGSVVCIDPGANDKKVIEWLKQYPEPRLDAILLTHGHFDHIGAVDALVSQFHCPVYLAEADAYLATHEAINRMGNRTASLHVPFQPYPLHSLTIGPFTFTIYDTPGHTEGSVCLQWKQYLFSGDTVFKNSVGRTDLYGGSNSKLKQSLTALKDVLDPRLIVYPGHAESTVWSDELGANPYLVE